jgi:CheY-like chemotaxis protein
MSTEQPVILLAEDDDGHATLIQRNLKRAGIINDIVHVRDGQDALDYVRAEGLFVQRPKQRLLLVLDINMPLVSGGEVLRQLKLDPATRPLPVIMLTTTDDPHEIQRCYELGCSVYLTKPIEYEAFVEAMKRLGMFLEIIKVSPDCS